MPELKGQRVAARLSMTLGEEIRGRMAYSLSTSEIDDNLGSAVVFFEELAHDLFYGVHAKPIPTVDEWVSANEFRKRLVEVGFIAEIQLGHAAFGDDATVVCLVCRKSRDS